MALWLQVVLALILGLLCWFLVPLLLQLRRTAAAVERLAEGARQDLHQMAADVHHLRGRADELADMATASLELPIGISRIASGLARTVEAFLGKADLPWISALMAGIKWAMNLIRRPGKKSETEEATHE
jgi:hypothetical protein